MLQVYAAALLLVLVLAWYLAHAGQQRHKQQERLVESEARLRTLSTQLITAQEQERRSISRDLHDEIGQLVTAISLDLQRAHQTSEPAKKNELMARAAERAECLLEQIHEIASRIRPALLDDLGLKDAVQSLLSDYERRTGIIPQTDLSFQPAEIPGVVSENTYRILHEALTNVARHGQAAEVHVRLHVGPETVSLVVRDTGIGFDPESLNGKKVESGGGKPAKHLGILGMRERAELLNGTFAIRSGPGQGTEIWVVLPLEVTE
jgi:signal transduction histidine kinase